MNTSNKIALAALVLSCLSLIVGIIAIVFSVRTSRKTTDQLTHPRVKVTLTQEQDPAYTVPATVLTATLQNVSTSARVLNPRIAVHIRGVLDADESSKITAGRGKHPPLHTFIFHDLAPGEQETKIFPAEDADAGEFDRRVSERYSGGISRIEKETQNHMPNYRIRDNWLYPTAFVLHLVIYYTPGIIRANEQRLVEEYQLWPVNKRVGDGITDLLEGWELK